MASFDITGTSPSENSASADVAVCDVPQELWTQEVMESFGHGRPPPPTFKIPRKEVNSTLIHTPTDSRARQLSLVPSVSNGARSSARWSNHHITLPSENGGETGPSSVCSLYASSTISPREGLGGDLETSYQFSGLGRGSGSKRSEGSSIEVAVGGPSRPESLKAFRQVFLRKESRVNRGPRGLGPEYKVVDSPIPPIPEANGAPDAISPININAIPVPRTLSIPGPERFQLEAQLLPVSPKNNYEERAQSYLPPMNPIRPLFTPPHTVNYGSSPNQHLHPKTPKGLQIPEHSMHSPYIHHSPAPVLSNNGGSIHATSAIGGASTGGDQEGLDPRWKNDPENPQNWNLKRKCYNTLIALSYTFAILFAGAVYLPAHSALAEQFAVSSTVTIVGFMLFTLGLVFGPALGVLLSDIIGRRPIYGLALPLSCIFTLGAGLATNLGTLFICRFFAAVVASPAVAIGFFMIGDMWTVEETKFPMMVYVLGVCGGPYLGPIIGGFAVKYGYWAWAMWLTLIVSAVIYMLSYFMSETHKTWIVRTRQKYLRMAELSTSSPATPGLQATISEIRRSTSRRLRRVRAPSIQRENRLALLKNGLQVTIVRAVKMLLFEPVVTIASAYIGFVFGCLFQTLVSVPLVFTKVYKVDLIGSGFTELGISGGMLASVLVLMILELTIHQRAQKRAMSGLGGNVAPEEKLQLVLFGSIMFPIGLFWWAWSAQEQIHWFLPILSGVILGFSGLSIILGLTLYIQEIYPGDTFTSVFSATTAMQWLLGAIFPLFTIPMYEKLTVGWAGSVMAFISLVFVPLPWILWKWGRDLRAATRFEVNVFCEKERQKVSTVV
ncbi:major facilitator superfamily domain-containing protein [Tirmania nivea]|nr:major facilitator superfamily domain-containing protein [Tirmania nivea]